MSRTKQEAANAVPLAVWMALEACEEVLRLIHDAAGPVPKDAPMPRVGTYEAWKMARRALDSHELVITPRTETE